MTVITIAKGLIEKVNSMLEPMGNGFTESEELMGPEHWNESSTVHNAMIVRMDMVMGKLMSFECSNENFPKWGTQIKIKRLNSQLWRRMESNKGGKGMRREK